MALRQLAAGGKTLPSLLKVLRKDISKPHLITQPLPSLRRTFSLYDQINLIDNVPEDQLRFQGYNPEFRAFFLYMCINYAFVSLFDFLDPSKFIQFLAYCVCCILVLNRASNSSKWVVFISGCS